MTAVSPIFADEDVPERAPTITKTVSGRGLRIEVRIFDEGVEFPSRELYERDNPRVYLAAYNEVQRDAFASGRALVNAGLLEFFAGYPADVEPPRSAAELRHERMREGRASALDLVMEGTGVNPDGSIPRPDGGYGRHPWEQ